MRWKVVLAIAIGACACRPAPQARVEKLVIGQLSSATVLDPHLQDDERTYSTLDHFYNKLVTYGSELQILPELATRWENLSDTVWRFHLRRGVVFHDGRPFGAEDVLATIRRAQSLPGTQVGYYVQAIRDIRVEDDATILFVTRDPTPVLLNKLVWIDVVPRGTGAAAISKPVGTGPYEYVSGKPGTPIIGRRFDRFWGTRPVFPEVRIVPLPDSGERAHAIPNGQADIVARFPEEYWGWAQKEAKMRLLRRQGVSATLLAFSVRRGSPFADVRVRRAVALTLDRAEVAARGMKGLGVPLEQIVPSTVFGFSNRLPRLEKNVAKAKALLSDAGFAGGLDADIILPDYLQGAASEIQRQLSEIGVRLRLIAMPFSRFNERWGGGEDPLTLFGWGAGTGDISDVLDALLHTPGNGYGKNNHNGYSSEKLDRLIEVSDRTLDPAARLELLNSAQELVREDVPLVPVVLRFDLYASRTDLDWFPRPDRRVRAFDVRPAR